MWTGSKFQLTKLRRVTLPIPRTSAHLSRQFEFPGLLGWRSVPRRQILEKRRPTFLGRCFQTADVFTRTMIWTIFELYVVVDLSVFNDVRF
jgi:hypothetical protein